MKVFHAVAWHDDVGDVEGFFNESGELLATWCLNDANWRQEYMGGLLRSLGVELEKGTPEHGNKLMDHWLGPSQ